MEVTHERNALASAGEVVPVAMEAPSVSAYKVSPQVNLS
jgi:hypothetical protein